MQTFIVPLSGESPNYNNPMWSRTGGWFVSAVCSSIYFFPEYLLNFQTLIMYYNSLGRV